MKEKMGKIAIVVSIILMLIIYGSLARIISIAKSEEKILDTSKARIKNSLVLEKYVNYSLADTKGVLVKLDLKTGIEYDEEQEYIPLKELVHNISLPNINGEYPESVEVQGISTKATNGSDNAKDYEYSYNKDNGQVIIKTSNNVNDEGAIYADNVSNAQDNYKINVYYSDNCYDNSGDIKSLSFTEEILEQVADGNESTIYEKYEPKFEVSGNTSGLISGDIYTTDIYNGYINANIQNGTNYQTEYTEYLELNIDYSQIADELNIIEDDGFINVNDEQVLSDEIIYKGTKLNKYNVLDILGEEGYIQILNANEEVLLEINKDTETEDDGTIRVDFANEENLLKVKTSKPQKVGTIKIENKKIIKETMKDTNNNKINTSINVKAINNVEKEDEGTKEKVQEKQEIYNFENGTQKEIKNAETRVDLNLDTTTLTNSIQNDVVFTATLFTDSSKYNLFNNPILEIKLPSEVEKVILDEASLLYDSSLNIKKYELVDVEGIKVIRVELEGMQKEYKDNSIIGNTNIIIPATLIMKKEINSVDTNIEYTYSNESDSIKQTKNLPVRINADYEIHENNDKIISISNDIISNNTLKANSSDATSTLAEIGDNLKVNINAKVGSKELNNGDTIYEKQVIKYIIDVKNDSDKKIENIDIKAMVPEGTKYAILNTGDYWEDTYTYSTDPSITQMTIPLTELNANENKKFFYEVIVDDITNGEQKNIKNNVVTKINGQDYKTIDINNVAKKAEMKVDVISYWDRQVKNGFNFWIEVTNLTNSDLRNVKIETDKFQKELRYIKAGYYDGPNEEDDNYDQDDEIGNFKEGKFYLDIDRLQAGKTTRVVLYTVAENFDYGINELEVDMTAKVKGETTDMYYSNEARRNIYPEYVTVVQTSNIEGEKVKSGEQISYEINIENKSKIKTLVNFKDVFSENLLDITANYSLYDIKFSEVGSEERRS